MYIRPTSQMTTLAMALQMEHRAYITDVAIRDVGVMIHQAYIANDYIRDGIADGASRLHHRCIHS